MTRRTTPQTTDAPAVAPSPEARRWAQQLANAQRLQAQIEALDQLAQAHRAERHAQQAAERQQLRQAHEQMAQALDQALVAKWLAGPLRRRALALLGQLADAGCAPAEAVHDRHAEVSLAQRRAERADAWRQRVEAQLAQPLDETGGSVQARLRAAMRRWQTEQDERRAQRRAARERRRTTDQEAAQQLDAQDALRRLFRSLASALHPDREPDPHVRERKTAWMAEANAAYERRDLLALMQVQQRLAEAPAAGVAEAQLAAYAELLKRRVADLERERAARQQALAQEAGLPEGVPANEQTLALAREQELAQLAATLAHWQRAVSQARSPERLQRWLQDSAD
jgi:hypothetical protein